MNKSEQRSASRGHLRKLYNAQSNHILVNRKPSEDLRRQINEEKESLAHIDKRSIDVDIAEVEKPKPKKKKAKP